MTLPCPVCIEPMAAFTASTRPWLSASSTAARARNCESALNTDATSEPCPSRAIANACSALPYGTTVATGPNTSTLWTARAPSASLQASKVGGTNAASAAQLQELDGVGPTTAEKILRLREERGGIGSVDDLDAIPGIGPKKLEALRQQLGGG